MKKGILIAALCFAGLMQSNAQYVKQVINFSLTGYRAPGTSLTTGYVRRFTPQTYSLTDRALCLAIANDKGVFLRYPQLIRVTDLQGNFIGYYVTDSGTVVIDASSYLGRLRHDCNVISGTEVFHPITGLVSVSDLNHAHDTWGIGSLTISGLDTIVSRFTIDSSGDPSTLVISQANFSAPVSGAYTNSSTGTVTCCTGSFRGTSVIVKSIPGLP
ncbi:MAG: hypothetical protein JWO95_806 [Verrucomicrobiales bacterium]|nr:hypothetical protein [Verrucomicrobiales bacterium]